jgi:RHS repeat-associated protein
VVNTFDYTAFGAPMNERSYRLVMKKGATYNTNNNDVFPAFVNGMESTSNIASENLKYRFGFHNQEKDDEVSGAGNCYNYGERLFDPRIGRFIKIDRLSKDYPETSPYSAFENSPILFIDPTGKFSVNVHEKITNNVIKQMGYTTLVANILGHYASIYADNPPWFVQKFEGNYKRKGIDYSQTQNSQNTGSITESRRHGMTADHEKNISPQQAMTRGQSFGWSKVFEAAKEGNLDDYKVNSKGAQSFGVGIHALQDSYAHKGTTMAGHSLHDDMDNLNPAQGDAFKITQSAILIIEAANGKFNNLKNGTTFDISGATEDQTNQIIAVLKKSGKTDLVLMQKDISGKVTLEHVISRKEAKYTAETMYQDKVK